MVAAAVSRMQLVFRKGLLTDIPGLVSMLSDDELGALREDGSRPLNQKYLQAFAEIESDANNELTVVESDGEVVGMLQLTFIPYLTYIGSWRCLIEGVRIHSDHRGQGLGAKFLQCAIEQARERACRIKAAGKIKIPEASVFLNRRTRRYRRI